MAAKAEMMDRAVCPTFPGIAIKKAGTSCGAMDLSADVIELTPCHRTVVDLDIRELIQKAPPVRAGLFVIGSPEGGSSELETERPENLAGIDIFDVGLPGAVGIGELGGDAELVGDVGR
jgi:hypothetical protein